MTHMPENLECVMSCAFLISFVVLAVFVTDYALLPAFGHNIGFDTTPDIDTQDKKIFVVVDVNPYDQFGDDALNDTDYNKRRITVTAMDRLEDVTIPDLVYRMSVYTDNKTILAPRLFQTGQEGMTLIDAVTTNADKIIIGNGMSQQTMYTPATVWSSTQDRPLEMTGPVFASGGGLYTFEFEIVEIDGVSVKDAPTGSADVILPESLEFVKQDADGNDVVFHTKSYFDRITSFDFNPDTKTVTFEMPFDWAEQRISHIPVVHEEIKFPKDYEPFLYPSYDGTVNGIKLFKASVVVDDYTYESERTVHVVLLQDHLRYLKNQIRNGDDAGIPDKMTFTLQANPKVTFPVSAWTRDESFQVDLSWDPLDIEPGEKTRFVYTIRDGATAEPLRNSDFEFVVLQGGHIIHKEATRAQIGGGFVDYVFQKDQTGPMTVRFDNIRGTGKSTEFGIMVVPEFGAVATMAALASGIAIMSAMAYRHRFTTV